MEEASRLRGSSTFEGLRQFIDQLPTVAFPQYAQGGIYRSPMSRAKQYICVTYKIWSYDFGAWLVLSRHRECDWVKRGRKVVPDPWEDQVEPHNNYRATVILTWQTRTRNLAREWLDYTDADDYRCYGGCEIGQTGDGSSYIYFDY